MHEISQEMIELAEKFDRIMPDYVALVDPEIRDWALYPNPMRRAFKELTEMTTAARMGGTHP